MTNYQKYKNRAKFKNKTEFGLKQENSQMSDDNKNTYEMNYEELIRKQMKDENNLGNLKNYYDTKP